MSLAPDDPRHGTAVAYGHHKCRCEVCTKQNRDRFTRQQVQRNTRLGDPRYRQPRHGTSSTYGNWRCRCGPCMQAKSRVNARNKAARQSVSS